MKALRKQETGEAGDQRQHLRPVLETVGLVVAPTTLLTSLLFFFGYMRSSALWDRFGLDLSVLGFSTQDYLLRGIDSVWVPLSVIVVTTLLVLQLHSYMVRLLRTRQHLRLVSVFGFAMQILGLAWFVLGVVGLASSRINYFLLTPLGGGLGVAGLAYGSYLVREVTRLRRSEEKIITDPRWITRGSLVMVCLFVLFSLFWAVGDWAAAIGRGRARDLIENLNDRLPGVTLYSRNNLHIEVMV